jgi:hypothetical protein
VVRACWWVITKLSLESLILFLPRTSSTRPVTGIRLKSSLENVHQQLVEPLHLSLFLYLHGLCSYRDTNDSVLGLLVLGDTEPRPVYFILKAPSEPCISRTSSCSDQLATRLVGGYLEVFYVSVL